MKSLAVRQQGGASAPPASCEAGWELVFAAWLVAAASTAGALFLSEIVGVAPCVLCWYQRVFMFPLVLVLAAGLFPLDRRVFRYAAPLAGAGWLVALYHVLLTQGYIPETMAPCTQGIPCSKVDVVWFGFLTLPMLSLLSFSAIGLILGAFYRKARP
jgi:disulfide bond formation protein DsbB